MNDDQIFSDLVKSLKAIEEEILPQLDMLAQRMPEVYKGYAKIVRETVDATLTVMRLDEGKSNGLKIAAEVAARGLEAYGALQAAKKHNSTLDKYLEIKKEIASLNYSKVNRLLPEVSNKLRISEKIFRKYSEQKYKLSTADGDTVKRMSNLVVKYLCIYRTNLFLERLCDYLCEEYEVWMCGNHTSERMLPDYKQVNEEILEKLFKGSAFSVIERVADGNGDMTGGELMLLSDPQLCCLTLGTTLCQLDFSEASPSVRVLLSNNEGVKYYISKTFELIPLIEDGSPDRYIDRMVLLAILTIVALCIFYIPGEWWLRSLIGISGTIAAIRIGFKNEKRLKIAHVTDTVQLANEMDYEISTYCGYVEQPEIDYERKDLLNSFVKGFFNK